MNPVAQSRADAARTVRAVCQGRSLETALRTSDSFARALVFGVLREMRLLEALMTPLLARPLNRDSDIHALILCGLHQLRAMQVAPHAAISETVNACALLGQERAQGLVNAVLRRYQRETAALEAGLPKDAPTRHSYPHWLAARIAADWGEQAESVFVAGNQQGPLTLRANRRKGGRAVALAALQAAGIAAHTIEAAPDALRLETARPVEKIPGFAEGQVSVQDAAAQLALDLLDLREGLRVLDACAAPGGKSAHLLESGDVELTALDRDGSRLARTQETLNRLGLQAQLVQGDATQPSRWWDGRAFDRILLDAPCSGTGVIRRHPDIKWLRRESDIQTLAHTQTRMLQALWPLLAPGGRLVYAVCSILREEGESVVRSFLRSQPGAKPLAFNAAWGEACTPGRRIAPGGDFDGFYYAVLTKPQVPQAG